MHLIHDVRQAFWTSSFSAKETTSMKVLHVADDDASLMIERGSFYAARGEHGPVIFRCSLHLKKHKL